MIDSDGSACPIASIASRRTHSGYQPRARFDAAIDAADRATLMWSVDDTGVGPRSAVAQLSPGMCTPDAR